MRVENAPTMIISNPRMSNCRPTSTTSEIDDVYLSDQMANSPPPGSRKWKKASAGKFENLARDLTAKIDNVRAHFFHAETIEHHQRRACAHVGGFFGPKEPAGHSAIIKRGVIGSVIDERPTEKRREEFLCRREIARWHLDVIDLFGSDSCIWQLELFFHRVKISRERVLSVRCGRTGRA